MRAIINRNKWIEFIKTYQVYGFTMDTLPKKQKGSKTIYVRPVINNDSVATMTYLIVTMDGELHLITPMGESPYMESHKEKFMDLIDNGLIDFVKGEYD